jgi:DNA-binding NarL/FixJ family response regulator
MKTSQEIIAAPSYTLPRMELESCASSASLYALLPRDTPEGEEKRCMAQVVALVDDLFFQAMMLETAKQLGVELQICTTPEALVAEAAKNGPRLAIVDLNARSKPLEAIVRMQATAPGIPVVAFLSHVQVELAEAARAAGCREVMPRSQFTRNLATILERAKSEAS